MLLFSFNKIYCFSSDACSGVRVAVSIGSMPVSTNTTEFNEGLVEDGLKCQINPISLVNLLLDREKIRTQTVPTNSYWKYTTLRGNKKFPLIHVVEI